MRGNMPSATQKMYITTTNVSVLYNLQVLTQKSHYTVSKIYFKLQWLRQNEVNTFATVVM